MAAKETQVTPEEVQKKIREVIETFQNVIVFGYTCGTDDSDPVNISASTDGDVAHTLIHLAEWMTEELELHIDEIPADMLQVLMIVMMKNGATIARKHLFAPGEKSSGNGKVGHA